MRETTAALYVYLDGREQCRDTPDGKMLYVLRRFVAWLEQGRFCAICERALTFREATTDHKEPRRMGGGFRDDRQANIRATHWFCNSEKGSKRG